MTIELTIELSSLLEVSFWRAWRYILGAPIGVHLSDNATEADFWAWGESIPDTPLPNGEPEMHSRHVIGWYGHGEDSGDPTKMDTEWYDSLRLQFWSIFDAHGVTN